MVEAGIENPSAREYWKGFNAYVKQHYPKLNSDEE